MILNFTYYALAIHWNRQKSGKQKKKKRFTPPSHEMTKDLQIYIFFALYCFRCRFVCWIHIFYCWFNVFGRQQNVGEDRFILCELLVLCHYLYLLHICICNAIACVCPIVRSIVPSFVCSFYGVGALVAVEY